MYFENFDLESIVTPVNTTELRRLLTLTEYDPIKTEKLVKNFEEGFPLGYEGPTDVKLTSKNLKFRGVGDKTVLWKKVMKEVKLKRFAGPFKKIPFKNFIQSLIGLVPKDGGRDCRLIFHLSHPRGKEKASVNTNIDPTLCSVKYPTFDQAVQLCIKCGVGCRVSKSDLTSAFRNLGMSRESFKYLIMKAESPIDGQTYYFVDKCLPFGSSISCAHFQNFSNALAHIVRWFTKKDLINYLDDFLFVALLKAFCDGQMDVFMDICKRINFPVSLDKTFRADTVMVFLGLLLDTVNQIVSTPVEKVERAELLIAEILNKKKMTLQQLQKICGFLNFLGRCVVPGRAFTRRLYMFMKGKTHLRPHHHLRISAEIREDLRMWLDFIHHPSFYSRGFMDFETTIIGEEVLFCSDASGSEVLGLGAICGTSWMYGQWESDFIKS